MSDTDKYFKVAALNFRTAEAHLKDAEDSLHALLERLEKCMESVKELSGEESPSLIQLDELVYNNQRPENRELHSVNL